MIRGGPRMRAPSLLPVLRVTPIPRQILTPGSGILSRKVIVWTEKGRIPTWGYSLGPGMGVEVRDVSPLKNH
jgi:hypothetical protein